MFAVLAAIAPLSSNAQTTFFSDNFTRGSTIGATNPAPPTAHSASYQTVSSLAWYPTPSVTANDLRFGITNAGSGNICEIQALFANSPIPLTAVGDNIQLTVVFTNVCGVFGAGNNDIGIGLFSSGQVPPLGGGLNGTEGTANVPGGVNGWQGYNVIFGPVGSTLHNTVMTRPAQTSGTGNQDLVTRGSTSKGYLGFAAISPSADPAQAVPPSTNQCYTDVFSITLLTTSPVSLAITNYIYSGPLSTVGPATLVTTNGGIATNTTYLVSGFDGFSIGFYNKSASPSNTLDIASVLISGQSTPVPGPPNITTEPVAVAVPSGATCDFNVAANGFSMTYQWHRNGTNLVDGGNISGSQSSMLVISPAGSADVASGANGYWVTISGAGGYSTNSTTNSLSLTTAKTLEWTAANGNVWDLDTTTNWQNQSDTPEAFNFGDNVTFDDFVGGGFVDLSGSFLSAGSVTVNSHGTYTFESTDGTGSIAGPGSLLYEGTGQLTLNVANTYTGGTVISNASAYVYLEKYASLGNGPVTFAVDGGQMEITTVAGGSASIGLNGDLVINANSTILPDSAGSFGVVFLADLFGEPGKTLMISPGPANSGGITRVRVYGTNTTYNANLDLGSQILFAPYSASGSQTYNGVISDSGAMMQKGTISYFNGQNTYSGGMNIAAGTIGLGVDSQGGVDANVTSGPIGTGPLLLTIDSTTTTTGSGEVMAMNGARTIGNSIQSPSGTNNLTLIVGGTNNLTFTGTFTLNGNDDIFTNTITARTIQVTNTAATTLSGPIVDTSGFGYGLIKTGNGALYLNGANTYTGSTTNNSGATNGPGLLAGSGSISGLVFVLTNSSIGGGSAASIGTLTINNNLTIAGNGWFRLNKSLGQQSDEVSVSGSLANTGTGTITVTNLGPALAVGDTFTLFSKAVANGSTMNVTGGGMIWTNKLALNGSIQALSVAPTTADYPTNVTFSFSGNTLTIGWPATHLGWILQQQTNSVKVGLSPTNTWYDVSETSSGTNATITVNPANPTVFFRLRHP
jgi:autotransporter-associated beta strand protein